MISRVTCARRRLGRRLAGFGAEAATAWPWLTAGLMYVLRQREIRITP